MQLQTIRNLLASIALSLVAIGCAASPYKWEVLRVVDGDTIIVLAPWLPPDLGSTIPLRIRGIDTPESSHRSKCDEERLLAESADSLVRQHITPGDTVTVRNISRDKYFRIVGDVEAGGHDIGSLLVRRGMARWYDGGTKKSWCN